MLSGPVVSAAGQFRECAIGNGKEVKTLSDERIIYESVFKESMNES